MVVVVVVVVVVTVVVVVLTVVVVVGSPTMRLSAGAQRITGLPTGTLFSTPNWSRRLTNVPLVNGIALAVQSPLGHVFALIL